MSKTRYPRNQGEPSITCYAEIPIEFYLLETKRVTPIPFVKKFDSNISLLFEMIHYYVNPSDILTASSAADSENCSTREGRVNTIKRRNPIFTFNRISCSLLKRISDKGRCEFVRSDKIPYVFLLKYQHCNFVKWVVKDGS